MPAESSSLILRFNLKLREFCVAQFAIVTVIISLCLFAYIFTNLTGHGLLLGFLSLLDVGNEQSIPTYVSVINLLLASLLILIIYRYEKINKQNYSGYWLFLAIVFIYLSIDESASIHEKFSNIHNFLVSKELISPILNTHSWLPFGAFFITVVAIVLLPLLRNLPTDTLTYFLTAGCVFVMGSVGFEYVGALMLETGFVESKADTAFLVRRIFEEGFEMYGIAIFNIALYREILRREISVIIGG